MRTGSKTLDCFQAKAHSKYNTESAFNARKNFPVNRDLAKKETQFQDLFFLLLKFFVWFYFA
ncbi:MAG: hypothetical protein C0623_07120 [Desulfuromonas sp.]|nr:MAG: hypothetical protein C0623_07120 [Desulfuromonas sp.]